MNLVFPLTPTGFNQGTGSTLRDIAWGHWNPDEKDPMPTAIKVDGIATGVYYTQARPADPFAFKKYYPGLGMGGIDGSRQSPQTPTVILAVTWFLLMVVPSNALVAENPHSPWNLTWRFISTATGEALTQTGHTSPKGTWLPDLTFDLGKLLQITWSAAFLQKLCFYVCSGHLTSKQG